MVAETAKQPTMAVAHRTTAIILFVLAAFFGWQAAKLQFYTPVGPGAGFFPICLSVGLGALAAVMFTQSLWSAPESMAADFSPGRQGALRIGATLAGLVFFVLALGPLGFRITTFVLSLCLIHVFGAVRPLVSVPVSAALGLGVYFIFSDVLKIALPTGPFGF